LGFSVSAFSHFFYRMEGCYPTGYEGEKYHRMSRVPSRQRSKQQAVAVSSNSMQ
jgi:hypothetical protein